METKDLKEVLLLIKKLTKQASKQPPMYSLNTYITETSRRLQGCQGPFYTSALPNLVSYVEWQFYWSPQAIWRWLCSLSTICLGMCNLPTQSASLFHTPHHQIIFSACFCLHFDFSHRHVIIPCSVICALTKISN